MQLRNKHENKEQASRVESKGLRTSDEMSNLVVGVRVEENTTVAIQVLVKIRPSRELSAPIPPSVCARLRGGVSLIAEEVYHGR